MNRLDPEFAPRFEWLDKRDLHQWDAVFMKRDISACIQHKMQIMHDFV